MNEKGRMRLIGLTAVLLVAALAIGCKLPGSTSNSNNNNTNNTTTTSSPTITITGFGWAEENIAIDFWTSAPVNNQTAYADFWINYSGTISYSDISYARVYLPDGSYWTINKDSTYLNTQQGYIGGWGRWYWTQQPNLLPVGSLNVEVKLTDGVDAKYTATIPAPASTSAGSFTTMHPEDEVSPPANSAPMVQRASFPSSGGTYTISSSTGAPSVST